MNITPKSLTVLSPYLHQKSHAHRAIICASFANSDTVISNVNMSQDMIATISALRQLGANIEIDGNQVKVSKYKPQK